MTETQQVQKSPPREDDGIQATTNLVPVERYLKTGAHIGTRFKTGEMKKYIFKQRPDGLKVLDVQTLDARILMAAQMIAKYPADKIVVVSRKLYGQQCAQKFAEATGAKVMAGRFVPGTFTNPRSKTFFEPHLVLTAESDTDAQAIKEAAKIHAPVISICSTNNTTKNVDLVIPANNKGRKSLALIFWLLARETLKARGEINDDDGMTLTADDFEYKLSEEEIREEMEERKRRSGPRRFGRPGGRGKGAGRRR